MASDSLWHRWRRQFLSLLFIVQYHLRLLFLSLRFKARRLSRGDINAHARVSWHSLRQTLITHPRLHATLKKARHSLVSEQVTAVLRLTREKLENERLHTTFHNARKRLEKTLFTDEAPRQSLDFSTLKSAWHSLDTGKIQRVVPDKLKSAWHSLDTGKLQSVAPKTLKAARHPWKTLKTWRHPRITLFSLILLSLLLIALFALNGWAGQVFQTIRTTAISTSPQFMTSILNPAAQHGANFNASKALVRISQLDANEYASQSEYDTWAYSACSAASMTEVLNSYGHHYRITDVLKVESAIGEITPELGLVENVGIANTAAKFGFQTTWGNNWTLDQVKSYANAGHPVIIGWPPARYDGGHIVVVTGGSSAYVYLADSSLWNRQVLTNAQFLQWWAGFAAVITPI
ncbi:MAG TPA: C39 family peptidase [Ktedonobacteraceae bacterium]|nr:C39 family peptidase [Ktedonobacteraceae bacterium]